MKNKEFSPYGTYTPTKIDAPQNSKKDKPRVSKIEGQGDLRGGSKK